MSEPGLGFAAALEHSFTEVHGSRIASYSYLLENAVYSLAYVDYVDYYVYYDYYDYYDPGYYDGHYYGGYSSGGNEQWLIAASRTVTDYYYSPSTGPLIESYTDSLGTSMFDGTTLSWTRSASSSGQLTTPDYSWCDASEDLYGRFVLSRVDFYARDVLPCTYSWESFYYDHYDGYGGDYSYYAGGEEQAFDSWALDLSSGSTITVEVDGVNNRSYLDTELWVNGPDSCIAVLGDNLDCSTGNGRCATLQFTAEEDGAHSVLVTQEGGCETGEVKYRLMVQVD